MSLTVTFGAVLGRVESPLSPGVTLWHGDRYTANLAGYRGAVHRTAITNVQNLELLDVHRTEEDTSSPLKTQTILSVHNSDLIDRNDIISIISCCNSSYCLLSNSILAVTCFPPTISTLLCLYHSALSMYWCHYPEMLWDHLDGFNNVLMSFPRSAMRPFRWWDCTLNIDWIDWYNIWHIYIRYKNKHTKTQTSFHYI